MKKQQFINNDSIGVFDSGFGGLDVLKEIVNKLPQYNYNYLGDSARAPYGNRSQEMVYNFTVRAVDFLFSRDCQLIILACNTSSSEALRKIQREYLPKYYPDRRVLGVIIPAAEKAVDKTRNCCIGVIGTQGTVTSGAFKRELKKLNSGIKVFQNACPLIVPIVEAGEQDSEITELVLKNYLNPLIKKHIDTLILGCTHYGLLEDKIRKIVGENINIIAEGKIVAEKLKDYLDRHPEIETKLSKKSTIKFLTTDLTDRFKILGSRFFGKKIIPEKIEICAMSDLAQLYASSPRRGSSRI